MFYIILQVYTCLHKEGRIKFRFTTRNPVLAVGLSQVNYITFLCCFSLVLYLIRVIIMWKSHSHNQNFTGWYFTAYIIEQLYSRLSSSLHKPLWNVPESHLPSRLNGDLKKSIYKWAWKKRTYVSPAVCTSISIGPC